MNTDSQARSIQVNGGIQANNRSFQSIPVRLNVVRRQEVVSTERPLPPFHRSLGSRSPLSHIYFSAPQPQQTKPLPLTPPTPLRAPSLFPPPYTFAREWNYVSFVCLIHRRRHPPRPTPARKTPPTFFPNTERTQPASPARSFSIAGANPKPSRFSYTFAREWNYVAFVCLIHRRRRPPRPTPARKTPPTFFPNTERTQPACPARIFSIAVANPKLSRFSTT